MAEASGPIRRESEILGNIAKQFNNRELSDVTLKVGEKSYYAHRFVLASHSTVFKTMLMNVQWRESDQKIIKLEEEPKCEAVFEEFLKFLYSGKVSLNDRNLCGIHMLADKYDLTVLKEEAETALKAFLSGTDGNALQRSLEWLRYIEQFVPEILPMCYEAIRTNFNGLCYDDELINKLESRDLKAILASNDIVVYNEMSVFELVSTWAKMRFKNLSQQSAVEELEELETILELVRFYNIDAHGLQKVETNDLCNSIGKAKFVNDYVIPAYKVHSQMQCIASSGGTAVEGQYKCPFDSGDICPHLNPRLYTKDGVTIDFEIIHGFPPASLTPIDLTDAGKFAQLQSGLVVESVTDSWAIANRGPSEPVGNEIFTLTPSPSHIGRQFTAAVIVHTDPMKFRHAIKYTGTVEAGRQQLQQRPREQRRGRLVDDDDFVGGINQRRRRLVDYDDLCSININRTKQILLPWPAYRKLDVFEVSVVVHLH